MANFGVYIHWPYCLSKCPYCDFFSKVKKDVPQSELIDGYIQDLQFYASLLPKRRVSSIFFGGGTPSLLQPQLIERLIDQITTLWPVAPNVEISLEANPASNSPTLFADLKTAGINRLSLGVQALNEPDLQFLGRLHNLPQAVSALEQAVKLFDNHSADLIYARPRQKLKDWQSELEQITAFGLKHLSLYQLTIEPGTMFYKRQIHPLEETQAAAMYEFTTDFLTNSGYPQYEVSNYAKPGFACRHNLLYWQGEEYLGIGPGAHGRIRIEDQWQATTHPRLHDPLTASERAEELILMGLRLTSGIDKKLFKQLCDRELETCLNPAALQEFVSAGLIADTPHSLRATAAGFPLLNYLINRLCL